MHKLWMLHALLHWPETADLELWLFAMDYAIQIWNNMPKQDGRLSPIEYMLKNIHPNYNHLQRFQTFMSPFLVLDPKLQDAKKIPKWDKRACRGQYLGISKDHSSTVGLILNLNNKFVSP